MSGPAQRGRNDGPTDPSALARVVSPQTRLQAAVQVAGGIAHDVNNLLTAIVGGVDAIAGRSGLDAATQEDVAAIRASAWRAAALVGQLLASGRPPRWQPHLLAINEAISGIASVLRRLLGARVRLEFALAQPGGTVRMDPTALDRVLVNLAANARTAMAGGGTLHVRTGPHVLHRPLQRGAETIPAGHYVMVEMQDTGGGIHPDVLPHIFERGFTTQRTGGNGLGLSTVSRIMRQCNGFLAVESAPGQGTRMRVYLPAAQNAVTDGLASTQASLPFPDPRPVPRGAVLLVDDEDIVRRIVERALAREGWRVLAAPTAEAASQLLGPDDALALSAIVTDLMLPGMGGAELVQAVRRRLGRPGLPAVLVSGCIAETPEDMRFLAKPYDIKDLAALLAEITL